MEKRALNQDLMGQRGEEDVGNARPMQPLASATKQACALNQDPRGQQESSRVKKKGIMSASSREEKNGIKKGSSREKKKGINDNPGIKSTEGSASR